MNKKSFIFAALLFVGCSSMEDAPSVTAPKEFAKIVNTAETSVNNTLVVNFNEAVVDEVERTVEAQFKTRSAATRSGVKSVDEVLANLEIESMERVFPEAGQYEERTRRAGLHRWYTIRFAEGEDLQKAAEALASVAEIQKIQYSRELKKASDVKVVPFEAKAQREFIKAPFNDPDLKWQWHYINNADQAVSPVAKEGADINVAEAWKLTTGDPRVVVAVIDEGVKYTHPDLAANMWVNPNPDPKKNDIHGWNFIDNAPISWGLKGDQSHGTHVAGTVAAVNNNGIGVAGVAGGSGNNDGVKIMSCQIFSGENRSSDVQSSQAIKYAADHGASILQCSYGYSNGQVRNDAQYEQEAPMEYAALKYFMEQSNCQALEGGLVIFASGNESRAYASYPGAYTPNICVTAFGPDYLPASYSNYGPGCNISAPGGEMQGAYPATEAGILSTVCSESVAGKDYAYMQGTSMSCPHVSGVAALGLSYALKLGKKFTRDEFNAMILTSVFDLEQYFKDKVGIHNGKKVFYSDFCGKMGTGAIDAYRLLMQVEGTPSVYVGVGETYTKSLAPFFGEAAKDLTYMGVEIAEDDMQRLGMEQAPAIVDGQLQLQCSNPGACKIKVSAVAGGKQPGTDDTMGGILITKEFSVIARSVNTQNGGWL